MGHAKLAVLDFELLAVTICLLIAFRATGVCTIETYANTKTNKLCSKRARMVSPKKKKKKREPWRFSFLGEFYSVLRDLKPSVLRDLKPRVMSHGGMLTLKDENGKI